MKQLLYVFIIILLAGCNQDNGSTAQTETTIDTTAYTRPLNITNEQVILLPEAREVTKDWLAYLTAESEIENFRNYNVNDVISNATPIAEIMESLRHSIPPRFAENAITTRVAVLYTKAKVLEHLARRRSHQVEDIRTTAEELPVEFNHFKIQLNEIFQPSLEDFDEELDDFENQENDTLSRPIPPPGLNIR